jgi:AhpD family alkylhydroperoxidase
MSTCPPVAVPSAGDNLLPARLAHLLRLALAVVDGCAACWTRHAQAARSEGCTGAEIASAMRMRLHEARAERALHYVLAAHAQAPQRAMRGEALHDAGFLPTQIAALDSLVVQTRHGAAISASAADIETRPRAPAWQVARRPG